MSKKNSKKMSANAKAAKNLEALKKAKEQIETVETKETKAVETKEEPKKEKPKVENDTSKQKVEASKEETKEKKPHTTYVTPSGKTAHETQLLCVKCPYMSLISTSLFKDEKNVECVKAEWKNNETQDRVVITFPVSHVTKGDFIDLDKLRGNEKPIEVKKEEEKPEKKKEEKPVKQTKKKKEEVIEAEEIDLDKMPTIKNPKGFDKPTDRIDANHSVDLLQMVLKRREEIKDNKAMYQATGKQADLMMWVLLQKWNDQFKNDAEEQGFTVNKEMFGMLNQTATMFLGVKLISNENANGQLEIDFKETISHASPQIQKALKQDAEAIGREIVENKKSSTELPKVEDCVTEDDKINAMRTIMKMRHQANGGKGGIGKNLINVIEFAKKAYSLDENSNPAQVLAIIMKKFEERKETTTLFEGVASAVFGNIDGNLTTLAAHGWMKNQLNVLPDEQVADVVTLFMSKKLGEIAEKDNKKFEDVAKPYQALIGSMSDDLINRIMKTAEKGEDDEKLVYKNLKGFEKKHISALKTVNAMKVAYAVSGKQMSDKMKLINQFYLKRNMIKPLDFYVEKSAYASK